MSYSRLKLETVVVKQQNMNEFTVHLVSSESMNNFYQNTLTSLKNISMEKLIRREIGELHWVRLSFSQK